MDISGVWIRVQLKIIISWFHNMSSIKINMMKYLLNMMRYKSFWFIVRMESDTNYIVCGYDGINLRMFPKMGFIEIEAINTYCIISSNQNSRVIINADAINALWIRNIHYFSNLISIYHQVEDFKILSMLSHKRLPSISCYIDLIKIII